MCPPQSKETTSTEQQIKKLEEDLLELAIIRSVDDDIISDLLTNPIYMDPERSEAAYETIDKILEAMEEDLKANQAGKRQGIIKRLGPCILPWVQEKYGR
ncbi:hypothetical protein PV08_07277 [Exophiala spinifera]|uniref:Uncharacterized protein n=1 Tax=Exophiala spinifera TaxID=91928 RepID=A0A0D2B6K9_9EURO|nr:uncharacterized protein PV08_07277 [Exophiala spinifera]KIW14493.1 hypothetical protein PV08_07277 [Exophiala spinifera]